MINSYRAVRSHSRVLLTFLDQVVSSSSNFLIGVAIAHLAGAVAFGEYMLVLLVWLGAVGMHRRLVTEPIIIASGNADTALSVIAEGLMAELCLGLTASAVTGAVGLATLLLGAQIGATILAFAPWFIPLLLQDYWRAIAFQRRRADLALASDGVFVIVQVVCIGLFYVLGLRSAEYIIAAWGGGAAAGAALGFSWFPAISSFGDGWRLLRRLWPLSRWLAADFATAFTAQQAYVAFAALVLTNVEYGGFRAASSLMGPTIVILLAASNVGLPEASRLALADRQELRAYARRLTVGTFCWVTLYAAMVAVAARQLLRILYGAEFSRFAPLAILAAVQYVIIVTVFGEGIALRATGQIRRLWRARVVIAPASVITLIILVHWLGYIGAAWGGVATFAYEAGATYVVYRRHIFRNVALLPPSPPQLSLLDEY